MGNYIDEALAQLDFALRLYHHVDQGKINPDEFNAPLTYKDQGMVFVCSEAYFNTVDNLRVAVWNNVGISFGAAAITLNRVREEYGHSLPNPIETESDQLIGLTYQIRNAFAHDISEPTWKINPRYRRTYQIGPVTADLSDLDRCRFEFLQVGGPGALKSLYEYGKNALGLF